MRSTISKDQSQELRQVLTKYRVSKETIELLLSSKNAAKVYRAYRQKKKIVTEDNWIIHFGANWAKSPEEDAQSFEQNHTEEENGISPPKTESPEEAVKEITSNNHPGEDLASRTLQTIVSFIRKPKPIAPPPKPRMHKVAIELDEEVLIKLKKLSDAENIPMSALIRLAIRKYID